MTHRSAGDEPFRILVLGDLTGRESKVRTTPLAQRKPMQVDVDNLDQVFARLAPRLDFTLDDAPLTIEFDSLDDFHPDHLFHRLPPFALLRELRAKLNDPSQFREAAAALGMRTEDKGAASPAAAMEPASDIERLLGRRPTAEPLSPPVTAGFDQWLKNVVSPYVVADTAQEQQQLIAAVDSATTEQMRRILHHPAFQSLEAAWCGITRLITELEAGETIEIFLLDASREEIVEDIDATANDLTHSALYRHLCGANIASPGEQRWSLIVGDYLFSPAAEDVRLLTTLGVMAEQARAPLLAGAPAEGLRADAKQLLNVSSLNQLDRGAEARWNALRASAGAAWIGLVLPRVLARLPYGAKTDPIESFEFEELTASRDHESHLWGNAAFALALLAGQAFQDNGWEMDLDGRLHINGLPSYAYREDGEVKLQPSAEVLISEDGMETILAHGLMPVMSYRNKNVARLMRWQSLANPAQALRGAWLNRG